MDRHYDAKKFREEVVKIKIRRAITMAKGNVNPDFAVKHPDWVRDAQQKKFSDLTSKITESVKRLQDNALKRRDKLAGKN